MTIEISKTAIAEIRRMQAVRDRKDSKFWIGFTSGGCQDFHYTLDLVDARVDNDARQEYQIGGIIVLIDRHQVEYFDRLKLDYAEDLMGGGFRFVNPLATTVCGCGNSFSMPTDAIARWQLPV